MTRGFNITTCFGTTCIKMLLAVTPAHTQPHHAHVRPCFYMWTQAGPVDLSTHGPGSPSVLCLPKRIVWPAAAGY